MTKPHTSGSTIKLMGRMVSWDNTIKLVLGGRHLPACHLERPEGPRCRYAMVPPPFP